MSERPEERRIVYHFRFDDGRERVFAVRLHPETLAIVDPLVEEPPEWTRLSFHCCENCPLDPALHERCPIAVRVVHLVDAFRTSVSIEQVTVAVETELRTYSCKTSLQRGLSALFGIYMVASGCPIMNRFRPMVDSHLPFATGAETAYRTVSMYVMAQFFRKLWGEEPDFELRDLQTILQDIAKVDVGFCDRLNALGVEDATVNALTILSILGEDLSYTLLRKNLEPWEKLFREHYSETPGPAPEVTC